MRKKGKKAISSSKTNLKVRMVLVSLLFLGYGSILIGRLIYLQIYKHEEYLAQSEKQYKKTVEIATGRGNIFDRNGNPLAINIDVESVFVNPKDILDRRNTIQVLSSTLNLKPKYISKKIKSNKQFVWIQRKCDLNRTEKLKQLGLEGVGFFKESKRFYPKRQLAASTLGFVGLDNQGLAGVEHYQHALLKGTIIRQLVEKDARGRYLPKRGWGDPLYSQNKDIVLTIDEVIQFIAEQELKNQVKLYGAKKGLAVVMNPNNGELLAMATLPEFNPNHYSAYPKDNWRNDIVSGAFEPGSIFKPILASAALEEGLAKSNDIFFCENGQYRLGNTVIGEAANHKFGWLTLKNIIAKSSNIGAIKIAQELGEKNFYSYLTKFGFGKKLGIDLPGEATGTLRPLKKWSKLSLASVSFGQEISTTPLQMIAAISTIANGGYLVRPYVTKTILKSGKPWKSKSFEKIYRVLSEETSQQMIDVLQTVVSEGTGKKASIKGFKVAGKTGTAQKIDPATKGYSKTAYVASFIGFVPANKPKLAILVMIDEPQKSHWGGEVAAPVFREIARKTLRYLNIPSSNDRVIVANRA